MTTTIAPQALLARLVDGEPTSVLDIRADLEGLIEAPSARTLHVPVGQATETAGELAADLATDTVVVCNRGLSARAVADALRAAGLDGAQVLEGGMRGWLHVLRAVPVETGVAGLEVRQIQRPGCGCLSYLVAAGGEALVVDPAPDTGFYLDLADELGARIVAVFDTHLHADHLSGARELAERAGAALHLPQPAIDRGVTYAGAVRPVSDGDVLRIGGVEVRALALPGHTTDMTGLLVAGRALISGDSLFADGLARPDLQHGDPEGARAMARTLHATLHERVLTLDGDTILLPGHDHAVVRTEAVAPRLREVHERVAELSIEDPAQFAEEILADMPPRPANYAAVIDVNAGRAPMDPELESGGNSCATR